MENIMLPSSAKILDIIHETTAEYTFRVAYDQPIRHGQFFQLSIPKVGEAPISVSAKGDGWIEFTIRKVGRLTEGLFGLQPGHTIFLRGPYGNYFPLESFDNKALVVIAGGTGMAAVRSLLRHYADNRADIRDVYLIAGFKDINSVLFTQDLQRFRETFNTIATLDHMTVPGFSTGLVTEHIPSIPFAELGEYNVVIVGPPLMMRFASEACIQNGADPDNMWLSFERKMSCAVGKCGHCKINETYVCLEGPIFRYTQAQELLD
ncbi:MAG: anaerobic sulfite reductase subunit AsrB [Clostridiaceae bacterium]|nr:anaerobic sulfite reductase subunit AsrB [Clostridiaceae bacterium]